MTRNTVIIKKYGNRRLYDTTLSAYINQDEVAQMVQEGRDVQVVDAATGEDLTRLVLTQIVVQHAKEPDSAFPLHVLRQMVAAYGKATQATTVKYMKAALDVYQNAFRAVAVPPMGPFEFMPAPFSPQSVPAVQRVASDAGERTRAMRSPGKKGSGADEVDDLKRRVAELESLVSKRRTSRSRKRKAVSRRKA